MQDFGMQHLPNKMLMYVAGNVSVDAVHLMALHEAPTNDRASASQDSRVHFSFAFLDAAAGRFYVGVADDDAGRSTLGALLTQVSVGYELINSSLFYLQRSPFPVAV